MDAQHRVLGPANTQWNDYVGTVAADDAEAVQDRPSLYELAHIDRDRYTILGIELNVDGSTTATIYAIDRIEHAITRQAEIVDLGRSRGEIRVTRFEIPEPHVEEFLQHQEILDSDDDAGSARPGSRRHRVNCGRGPRAIAR